jgi:hypothetical protein
VLIEPVAQMAGRALHRRGITRINGAGKAWTEVGWARIAGTRGVGSRPSLSLRSGRRLISWE